MTANMRPPIISPNSHSPISLSSGAQSNNSPSGISAEYEASPQPGHGGTLASPCGMSSQSVVGATNEAMMNEETLLNMSQSMDSINTIGTNGGSDGVRTLFVSGLPLDTKSRELYLLFRGYKGYLSSTLKPAGKNGKLTAPVGFVTFETREQAELAMSDLKGVKFDPEGTQHMRLEFARSNTKVTRPKANLGTPMIGPLGIAGMITGAMPTVSSPNGGQFGAQQQAVAAQQQALNLANFTAAMNNTAGGIMPGISPAIFPQLTSFDASLLAHDPSAMNTWPGQMTFDVLSQAGLLSQTPGAAAQVNTPNSLTQAALMQQQQALAAQLSVSQGGGPQTSPPQAPAAAANPTGTNVAQPPFLGLAAACTSAAAVSNEESNGVAMAQPTAYHQAAAVTYSHTPPHQIKIKQETHRYNF